MKFIRNIFIMGVITLSLFYVSVKLAENSSENTAYIYIIAGGLVVLTYRIASKLMLFSSIEKDINLTPKESKEKSLRWEKYYIPEIIMFIFGMILFIYGNNEYNTNGVGLYSIIYFLTATYFFFMMIKGLLYKNSRIEFVKNYYKDENIVIKKLKLKNYILAAIAIFSSLYVYLMN